LLHYLGVIFIGAEQAVKPQHPQPARQFAYILVDDKA
jgi:hypothetical protein